jgi:hypothetical protein
MKKELPKESLEKLEKLTKLLKRDKVAIEPKGPVRSNNKWRSGNPKYVEKAPKPQNLIQAGGMEVDPSRKEEYDNWRKDKIEEQNYRRGQMERKFKAAREAKSAADRLSHETPPEPTPPESEKKSL